MKNDWAKRLKFGEKTNSYSLGKGTRKIKEVNSVRGGMTEVYQYVKGFCYNVLMLKLRRNSSKGEPREEARLGRK